MELHVAALFNHDHSGRITGTNDGAPPGIAPRLFLGRTRQGNVWRLRADVPDETAADLVKILASESPATELRKPPETDSMLSEAILRLGPIARIGAGPAFRFPVDNSVASDVVMIDTTNVEVVRKEFPDHFPWLADEFAIREPIAAIPQDGIAVSICFCARLTPNAAEAGVDSSERFRGRGFASRATSAWADALRESGRTPLYSTSWDNLASQHVARKLGLVIYGADYSIY
jgi:hypothetical protein